MNPIMTIGYEGVTAEELVAQLKQDKIDILLDCRIRAGSRKKGMSKTPLSKSLDEIGIRYMHDRDLGTPKHILQEFRETGHYDWDAYLAFLKTKMGNVEYAAKLSSTNRVCLLCFEADASTCHRRFVAQEISKVSGGDIIHLKVSKS